MYLLLTTHYKALSFAAYTSEGDVVYSGESKVDKWDTRTIVTRFESDVVGKVRGHGKLFSKVGIVIPWAPADQSKPILADIRLLKRWMITSLRRELLSPILAITDASKKAWPHLTHVYLFDTHLSSEIERHLLLPPFAYDDAKRFHLQPQLLHSYGHRANVAKVKKGQRVVSVVIDREVSMAVFEGEQLLDAYVSYSPQSPIGGLYTPGAFEAGFMQEFIELHGSRKFTQVIANAGLKPMTENKFILEQLLTVSGLAGRRSEADTQGISIEAIEWIELATKQFVRSLQHAIGGLVASHSDISSVVFNTSRIPESSPLWKAIMSNGLSGLKATYCDTSMLEAACRDLRRD